MFTPSQLIAALIKKMGSDSVTLTYGETMQFGTKWPTAIEVSDDGSQITLTISPDTFRENQKF